MKPSKIEHLARNDPDRLFQAFRDGDLEALGIDEYYYTGLKKLAGRMVRLFGKGGNARFPSEEEQSLLEKRERALWWCHAWLLAQLYDGASESPPSRDRKARALVRYSVAVHRYLALCKEEATSPGGG
jgi:hypothetical protein